MTLPYASHTTTDHESTSTFVDEVGTVTFDGMSAVDESCGGGMPVVRSLEDAPIIDEDADATLVKTIGDECGGPSHRILFWASHAAKEKIRLPEEA